MRGDRFGIGWRDELAAGILAHGDRIDVVEVIAEEAVSGGARRLRALRTLARQLPVVVHGVALGLASCWPVDERRLATTARAVDAIEPEHWSEHLSFVRAGGVEIGHLAAAPRTRATLEGLARNVDRARAVVGAAPWLENVATLLDPPASTMGEAAWFEQASRATGCDLLLDLHNLYANAVNFGYSAEQMLDSLPLDRVACVHIAGGRWIGRPGNRRLLDDHLHRVPQPVFDMLRAVGERATLPLVVILERDGSYPAFDELLRELDDARAALALGRARRPSAGAA